ncbi:MAG: alpha/beta hydrolase [Candidatus Eiseniibacteriota bacterium]
MKSLRWILTAVVLLVALVTLAFKVSPWPSALIIRHAFNTDAAAKAKALRKHVPGGVAERLNQHYALHDRDARLDVFFPSDVESTTRALPTIVWVHGGGWISGSKQDVANYVRILAGRGFTTVGIDYSIAPAHTYPTPLRQVNEALGYLTRNAARLHVDPDRLILAGDSGGAHIVSQVAVLVGDPSYAKRLGITPAVRREQLAGMLLYCGAYDVSGARLDGPYGSFLKTMLWAYSGERSFQMDTRFETATVIRYVTPRFPPSFISAGNGDPLESQSRAMAARLVGLGVRVDSLFYPEDLDPALPHEYQFNLDSEAGRGALDRSVAFLATIAPAR